MDQAVLVEKDRRAQAIVATNIAMTQEEGRFQLLKMEDRLALQQVEGPFELVLLDPPYAKERIEEVITLLDQKGLLGEEVMVVCETDKAVELAEEVASLGIWKQKVYGISKVTVYVR